MVRKNRSFGTMAPGIVRDRDEVRAGGDVALAGDVVQGLDGSGEIKMAAPETGRYFCCALGDARGFGFGKMDAALVIVACVGARAGWSGRKERFFAGLIEPFH